MRRKKRHKEYICAACGAKMYLSEDRRVLICSNKTCNYGVEVEDYGTVYDIARGEYDAAMGISNPCSDIPECCSACGGPYPDCMISCNLFSD